MKLAICTLCIGKEAREFGKYSIPVFKKYAAKIGADFILLDTPKVNYNKTQYINPVKFEKYQLYDVLEEYDRVAFFDIDVLITPHATNIFRAVSSNKIGGVFEDVLMQADERRRLIKTVQKVLGDVGWKKGFLNTGVMVVSQAHQFIFKMIEEYGIFDDPEFKYEQTNTNWYIHMAGLSVKNIDQRWNFMGWMRIAFGPIHRDAYAIHYAGGGIFSGTPRVKQMQDDFDFFYPDIKPEIVENND